jgi:hypothetical protein
MPSPSLAVERCDGPIVVRVAIDVAIVFVRSGTMVVTHIMDDALRYYWIT